MQSKEKPKNGEQESSFYPKPEIERKSSFYSEAESELYQDTESLDRLRSTMTPPAVDIALTTAEDLEKPNWFARLLGIPQAIEDTTKSDLYQQLNSQARELEADGGFMASMAAGQMRETAGNMMMGNILINVADFEERPRKIFFNLIALKTKRDMAKVRNPRDIQLPITNADLRGAISDGLDGIEYIPSELSNILGFVNPAGEVGYQENFAKFAERHPNIAKVASVPEAMTNFAICIGTEIGIAKYATLARKGAVAGTKGFVKGVRLDKVFRKFIKPVTFTDTIDDVVAATTRAIAKDAGATDPIDGLIKAMQGDPDNMDEVYRVYTSMVDVAQMPGAKSIDDVLQGMIYRKWIDANIITELNPKGVLTSKEFKNLLDSAGLQTVIVPGKTKNILFHGSPTGALKSADVFVHTQTWREGVGLYTTDSLEQARAYALGRTAKGARKTQATKAGAVTFIENLAKKELDMDAAIDRKLWDKITEQFGWGSDYLTESLEKFDWFGKLKTNTDAYEAIRLAYVDEVGESGAYAINEALVDMGYGATKHLEGVASGTPHTVRIFINPEAVKVVDELPQAVRKTKSVNELTVHELEDIALEIQSIKHAPAKWRNGFVEMIRRRSYGPPVNTFSRLGLERQFARQMDGIYKKNNVYNHAVIWLIDKRRQFKKRFKKSWEMDNPIDMAAGRLANGVPVEDFPDELLKAVSPEELSWLDDAILEDKGIVFDPLRDEAIKQGRITRDPKLIAAGVPPVKERYFHWMNEKVTSHVKRRWKKAEAEGKKMVLPPDYDLKNALKKKPVTELHAGEFIARDGTPADIDYSYIRVRNISIREEAIMLYVDPEFQRFEEAVRALPADIEESMRKTALDSLNTWSRQARSMPADVDMRLNKAFNKISRKMEKLPGKWEARERTFQNFAEFMSRRIDQGLLLGNPRPTVRNLFQSALNANLYGNMNTLWGYQQLLTPGGRKLLKTSHVYLDRGIPLAAFNITDKRSWKQLTYLGIHLTDKYLNVGSSYLTAWKYYFQQNRRAWDDLAKFAADRGIKETSLKRGSKFSDTLADAINAGMFTDARRMIDYRGVALTQWMYDMASASPMMHSSFMKLNLKYNTWGQYMWGGHMPQLWEQLRTGKDIFGMAASPSVRSAYMQMIIKGALLYTAGETIGVSMEHLVLTGSLPQGYLMGQEMPVPISPAVGTAVGLGATGIGLAKEVLMALGTVTTGSLKEDNRMLDLGLKQLTGSLKTMIPLYGLRRQIQKVKSGEMPPEGIFWPKPRKKREKGLFKLPGI